MADLRVVGDNLVLSLPPAQKFFSFHGNISVPATAVRSVEPLDNPWLALRGRRMAGTAMRGVAAMGTWIHGDRRHDFCIVRGQQPGLQVDLMGGRFDRFIIGLPPGTDAAAAARRLDEEVRSAGRG